MKSRLDDMCGVVTTGVTADAIFDIIKVVLGEIGVAIKHLPEALFRMMMVHFSRIVVI